MQVKLFFCYAHEDEALLNKLKAHLKPLQRQGLIDMWHDREISAGTEWEKEISKQLNEADIILLLVSPDFMNSDYSYSFEMQRALERHERGEAWVIPVILRHIYWQGVLGKLQALPKDASPVKSWLDPDEALFNVAEGIRTVVEGLMSSPKTSAEIKKSQEIVPSQSALQTPIQTNLANKVQKTKEQWLEEGNAYYSDKHYNEAIAAYEQAIALDHNYVAAYDRKGWALYRLDHYKEALDTFEQAIALDSHYISAYAGKGWTLYRLKRYKEALAIFEQITALDPSYISGYDGKGWALYRLRRYNDALAAFEQAIVVDPFYVSLYDGTGWTFYRLHRYKEALTIFEQFINLDPNNSTAYDGKGWALYRLRRYNDALAAFKRAIELDPNKASAYDGKNSVLEKLKSTK